MNFGLKSTLTLLFAISLSFGALTDEAAAQGPFIKKLRSFNKGRPLLPFIPESKPEKPPKQPTLAQKPTPAKAGSAGASGSRTPTPARQPTPAKDPSRVNRPTPANAGSGSAPQPSADQTAAAKGFGMRIQQSGERFFISQVDTRGNAAAAGLRRGDLIVNIGGAPVKVVEEYEAIAKAMKGGDRVEFEVARRGNKPEKLDVQFGKAPAIKQPVDNSSNEMNVGTSAPANPEPIRYQPKRYEPPVGSGLQSVYEGNEKPSSVFTPTPAPRTGGNRVQSLEQLDFPALELDR